MPLLRRSRLADPDISARLSALLPAPGWVPPGQDEAWRGAAGPTRAPRATHGVGRSRADLVPATPPAASIPDLDRRVVPGVAAGSGAESEPFVGVAAHGLPAPAPVPTGAERGTAAELDPVARWLRDLARTSDLQPVAAPAAADARGAGGTDHQLDEAPLEGGLPDEHQLDEGSLDEGRLDGGPLDDRRPHDARLSHSPLHHGRLGDGVLDQLGPEHDATADDAWDRDTTEHAPGVADDLQTQESERYRAEDQRPAAGRSTAARPVPVGQERAPAPTGADGPPGRGSTWDRWRQGRLDPGRRGVAALALVAVLAALLAGVVVLRSRPHEVVPPPVVAPGVPVPGSAPSAASLEPTQEVVVSVGGKVAQPGLVKLPSGSRVDDAVKAAGVLPGTDLGDLNLARKLVDGEQVLVGVPQPAGVPAATPSAGGLLDLNAATLEQFDDLPGIGPVLAQKILDWRTEHGRFGSVDQLREVSGIGESKYAELKAKVRV